MIKIETKDAVKGIERLALKLSSTEARKAHARAINHTLGVARTLAARSIREKYNMPYAEARKATAISRANSSRPVGYLKASAHRTKLSSFNPRMFNSMGSFTQIKRGVLSSGMAKKSLKLGDRRRIGIMEVEIKKGKKTTIRSAFFLPTTGGSTVMARGVYGSAKDFNWRHRRVNKSGSDTPISALDTVSVYKAAVTPSVQKRMLSDLGPRYRERVKHEITHILSTL